MCMRVPPHSPLLFALSMFTSGQSADQHPAILGRRAVPEIGGSQGGFIGLVVALGVLILICCIAVFFLLRNHEPSDQDRASRRERYRRQRDRGLGSTATATEISSFGDKLRGMWANGPSSGSGSGSRRGGRGWIKAGSGDEWETHSDHDEEHGAQPMNPIQKPFENTFQETDSPLSDVTSGLETYTPTHYTGPYAQDSSHRVSPQHVNFVRSQSPLPLSGSPIVSGSHHQEADIDEDEVRPPDHRHFSTQSSISVRTFEGGTKFIESL